MNNYQSFPENLPPRPPINMQTGIMPGGAQFSPLVMPPPGPFLTSQNAPSSFAPTLPPYNFGNLAVQASLPSNINNQQQNLTVQASHVGNAQYPGIPSNALQCPPLVRSWLPPPPIQNLPSINATLPNMQPFSTFQMSQAPVTGNINFQMQPPSQCTLRAGNANFTPRFSTASSVTDSRPRNMFTATLPQHPSFFKMPRLPKPFVSELEPQEDLQDLQLKKLLKKFEDIAKVKPNSKENIPISVAEYSAMSKQAFEILQELDHSKGELEFLVDADDKAWNHKVKSIVKQQTLLCDLLDKLDDPNNIKTITAKLKKIRRKRAYKNQKKKERFQLKVLEEESRAAKHAEIDRFMESVREKDEQKKREAEMKKEADCILSEVRKKIHEGKQTLKKLKILEKCRSSKKENALKKGMLILPTHDRNFENKLSEMKATTMKQMSDYEAEERALKVMLDTEHEEQREMEIQWKVKKLQNAQNKKHLQIMSSLFGDSELPNENDPMYLFHQFGDAANKSIEKLAKIRHSWDVYLVPTHNADGSSIPQQWVTPGEPSSDVWASVLQT